MMNRTMQLNCSAAPAGSSVCMQSSVAFSAARFFSALRFFYYYYYYFALSSER